MKDMSRPRHTVSTLQRLTAGVGAAGAAAASYMTWEARWIECRQADLAVPGLPAAWSGLTVLHISDVHAGSFTGNERNLEKVVEWAVPLEPDLVVLTGDVLGPPRGNEACLGLLDRLDPPLGKYAVTGNHEYGLSKAPLARPRATDHLWQEAGITLLRDTCTSLRSREDTTITLCGADHLTGGYGLHDRVPDPFAILLVHEPPQPDSPLAQIFSLAFAGHTHGGQMRVPGRSGLVPLQNDDYEHHAGVHDWGRGKIVITRGVGASFLPFRLFTRPEATLWRLV